jgi:small-conductance mechanosensitive channel
VTLDQLRDLWNQLDPFLASSSGKTLLLLAAVGLVRMVVARALDRPQLGTPEVRRRWRAGVRNLALIIAVAGVVLLWAEELGSLMLSLVALGAAFVIAFKEVINCLSGTVVRTTTGAFGIGDRIELAGLRGDVVDYDLLSTTLMEVGPGQTTHQYTGRTIVVPNSLFLANPVFNDTFTDEFLLHVFVVAIPRTEDWKRSEDALLAASWAECSGYIDRARKFLQQQARQRSLEPIDAEPRVNLRLDDAENIQLVVRVVVPCRKKGRIEQGILRRYLQALAVDAPARCR